MRLNVCFATKKSEPLLFMDFVTLSQTPHGGSAGDGLH